MVFQKGSTFKLTCETNGSIRNVTWQSPDSRIPPIVKASKSIKRWRESQTNKGITVATLKVLNATYADTGYYTCLNVQNTSMFSEQYVFIQGRIMQICSKCVFNINYWVQRAIYFLKNCIIDESTPFTFSFKPLYQVEPSSAGISNSSFHIGSDSKVVFKAVFSSPVTVGIIQTSPDVDVRLYHLRVRENIKTQVNEHNHTYNATALLFNEAKPRNSITLWNYISLYKYLLLYILTSIWITLLLLAI